jgi:hypothetical protein
MCLVDRLQTGQQKAYKEVLKECGALADVISASLGNLVEHSFSSKMQESTYDAMLEEFKWLQSLPSQSHQLIEDILPPGGSAITDKFRSGSMVSPCAQPLSARENAINAF